MLEESTEVASKASWDQTQVAHSYLLTSHSLLLHRMTTDGSSRFTSLTSAFLSGFLNQLKGRVEELWDVCSLDVRKLKLQVLELWFGQFQTTWVIVDSDDPAHWARDAKTVTASCLTFHWPGIGLFEPCCVLDHKSLRESISVESRIQKYKIFNNQHTQLLPLSVMNLMFRLSSHRTLETEAPQNGACSDVRIIHFLI